MEVIIVEVLERVFKSKLLIKIEENKEFSTGIGVTDVSMMAKVKDDRRYISKKECVLYEKNSDGFGVLQN